MRAEYGHDDARHLQSAPGQPLTRRSPRKRRKSGNAGPFPSSARVWSRFNELRRCQRPAACLRMTTSWPRPELAAGPVCQQFRERDAGPAVFPTGAGSSMERAARRRTARRTVGAGILPQNGPGRQAEHRGLSWIWGERCSVSCRSRTSPRWLRSSAQRPQPWRSSMPGWRQRRGPWACPSTRGLARGRLLVFEAGRLAGRLPDDLEDAFACWSRGALGHGQLPPAPKPVR